MTKTVKVKVKGAGELTYSGITAIEAGRHQLRLFEASGVVADFDRADISSWYEVQNSD